MPAKSKAQQQFMGMVHAVQKGELSPSKVSDKVKDVADNMSDSDAEDFASTKHKGKPEKVAKEVIRKVREILKPIVKESYASMFGEMTKHMKSSHQIQATKELSDEYDIGRVLYVFRTNRRAFDKAVKDKMKEMKQFKSAKKLKEGGPGSGKPKDGSAKDSSKEKSKKEKELEDKAKEQAMKDMEGEFDFDESLHPYKDFNQQDPNKQYDLNLGAFIDKYQQMIKFMKKYKEVPDKNKRAWAAAIRKKVGKGRFNGLIGDWSQLSQYLKDFDKFRNQKDPYAWDIKGESINESAVSFWQDMFRPGPIPKRYINQLIKKKGELPSKSHIKAIYRSNGNPSSRDLAKTWKDLTKEKYVRAASGMWRWNKDFTGWESVTEGVKAQKAYNNIHKARNEFIERYSKLRKQLNTLKTESPNNEILRLEKQLYKFETAFIEQSSKLLGSVSKIAKSNLTEEWRPYKPILEKIIKIKKDPHKGVKNTAKGKRFNPLLLKGEDKIKALVWSGANPHGKGSYELKGNKLNVIGLNPRDKGFYVSHFTKNTKIRRANLYYDGVHWQGKKKF